jgi:hypothetical protein
MDRLWLIGRITHRNRRHGGREITSFFVRVHTERTCLDIFVDRHFMTARLQNNLKAFIDSFAFKY